MRLTRGAFYICNIIMSLVVVCSCLKADFTPSDWSAIPKLELSNNLVVFNSMRGADTVLVQTNYKSFDAYSTQDWCVVRRNENALEISVVPNTSTEQRSATVHVAVGRGDNIQVGDISVVQFGGIWDVIGCFDVFWSNEISNSQKSIVSDLLNSLVYVEGGTFVMGTGDDSHQVTLSSYYMCAYEITQKQWLSMMTTNPSQFVGADLPVENISWLDALEYVSLLSSLTNLKISLPTEAQWEYAARGGQRSLNYAYPGSDDYKEVAYYAPIGISEDSPLYSTSIGGSKMPNELGIYDMAGNVGEYCWDWYGDYKDVEATVNPEGVVSGDSKVIRGGDFILAKSWLAYDSKFRGYSYGQLDHRMKNVGLRIVVNR